MPRCNDDESEEGERSTDDAANGSANTGYSRHDVAYSPRAGSDIVDSEYREDSDDTSRDRDHADDTASTERREAEHGYGKRSQIETSKQAEARLNYESTGNRKKRPSDAGTKATKKRKVDKRSKSSSKEPDINAG